MSTIVQKRVEEGERVLMNYKDHGMYCCVGLRNWFGFASL